MNGALAGIRVLDLSRVLAGPWATQMLADFGADVVKIERPGVGDDTRTWGPPWFEDEGDDYRQSAYFLSANRGKRSVALDMADAQDNLQLRALARAADVLVENFKVGGLARYKLDYETLSADNPGLIYCSISGFGQTGPYQSRAGYDFMIQGMGGLMSVTGDTQSGPMKTGVALADVMTGLYASNAILAALQYRQKTGLGQHIDLALLDVQVATLANQASNYLVSGESPGRLGNAHPNIVPYQAFASADGHIILAIGNDAQFRRFCIEAGREDLADDARFTHNAGRVAARAQLVPEIAKILGTRTTSEWMRTLEPLAVPCGPINDMAAVFADPQVQARGMYQPQTLPSGGQVPGVANPIRFSRSPCVAASAPPELGAEEARKVLRDWGQA